MRLCSAFLISWHVTMWMRRPIVLVFFFFLFIFVTKKKQTLFCFHTIEIKSCKKNLHLTLPHEPPAPHPHPVQHWHDTNLAKFHSDRFKSRKLVSQVVGYSLEGSLCMWLKKEAESEDDREKLLTGRMETATLRTASLSFWCSAGLQSSPLLALVLSGVSQ